MEHTVEKRITAVSCQTDKVWCCSHIAERETGSLQQACHPAAIPGPCSYPRAMRALRAFPRDAYDTNVQLECKSG